MKPFNLERALAGDKVVHVNMEPGKGYRGFHLFECGDIGYERRDSISSNWSVAFMSLEICKIHFRMEPRTITVNGFEIAAPERGSPHLNQYYYYPTPAQEYFISQLKWVSDGMDLIRLKRGLVHLTKENAIAHARAMLGIES